MVSDGLCARRSFGRTILAVILAALMSASVLYQAPDAGALDGNDAWSDTVTLRTPDGRYAQPVHGTLMPDGRVHFFGLSRDSWPAAPGDKLRDYGFIFEPDPIGASLPSELATNAVPLPVVGVGQTTANGAVIIDGLTCAGHTLTADGRVFTAGGARVIVNNGNKSTYGLPTQTIYDGASWRRVANIIGKDRRDIPFRWYPTTTRLDDGQILVAGGFDRVFPEPTLNLTTELYDPVSNTSTLGSPYTSTPTEIFQSDYTHVWQLPYSGQFFDILMMGQMAIPVMNSSLSLDTWEVRTGSARPGVVPGDATINKGTSSVMLPIRATNGEWGYSNGSIMQASGKMTSTFIDQAEVYDPIFDAWSPSIDLGTPRHHPNTILLPDSRVLILAGHNTMGDDGILHAQYVDPANGFSVTEGSSAAQQTRGYHSVSLLLPDGRILLAGGRDSVTLDTDEKPTYQYYEPDYMSAVRPELLWAPSSLDYSAPFAIHTSGAEPAEVVMVGLGSMTHSFDMNQRLIELDILSVDQGPDGSYLAGVGSPFDSHVAPPGYYMLFVLDADRIPSMAKMVRIE